MSQTEEINKIKEEEEEEDIIKNLQKKLRGRPKKAVTEKVKPIKENVVKEKKKRSLTEENKK